MRDTDARTQQRYYELLRRQSGIQRLRTAMDLTQAARALAVEAIRQRHPAASEKRVRALLAERLYGASTARRLFGDD